MHDPPHGAHPEERERTEQDREGEHGARQGHRGVDGQSENHLGADHRDDGAAGVDGVAKRRMLPRLRVQAERQHRGELEHGADARVPRQARQHLGQDGAVEAEKVSQDWRHAPHRNVGGDLVWEQVDVRQVHTKRPSSLGIKSPSLCIEHNWLVRFVTRECIDGVGRVRRASTLAVRRRLHRRIR